MRCRCELRPPTFSTPKAAISYSYRILDWICVYHSEYRLDGMGDQRVALLAEGLWAVQSDVPMVPVLPRGKGEGGRGAGLGT